MPTREEMERELMRSQALLRSLEARMTGPQLGNAQRIFEAKLERARAAKAATPHTSNNNNGTHRPDGGAVTE